MVGRPRRSGRCAPATGTGCRVPITARPWLQRMDSSGVASAREVGLDSGKITGRRVDFSAMVRTIGSENDATAGPIRRSTSSAWRSPTTSRVRCAPGCSSGHGRDLGAPLHERLLERCADRACHRPAGRPGRPCRTRLPPPGSHAGLDHRAASAGPRCRSRRSRRRRSRCAARSAARRSPDGRQQRPGRDRGRALDVVVEGAQPVAIALQQPRGVRLGEVLPLQQHVRPALRSTAVTNSSTKSSYSWPRTRSCRQPM